MPRAPQHRPDAPNGGGKWTRKNELFLWHARKSNSTHWTHEKIGKELGKSALACRLKYHKLNVAARKGKWSPDEQASPSSASARALMPPPAPPQPRPLAPATTPNFRDATGMRPSSQSTGTSSDSDHARQRSSRRHQPSMQRSEMHQEPPRHQHAPMNEAEMAGAASLMSLSGASQPAPDYGETLNNLEQSNERVYVQLRGTQEPAREQYSGWSNPLWVVAPAHAQARRVPDSTDGNPTFQYRVHSHSQHAEDSHPTAPQAQHPSRVLPLPSGLSPGQASQPSVTSDNVERLQSFREEALFHDKYIDRTR